MVVGGGLVTKSCPTLVTPWTVCSLPGFSVHGISQAKILEWVALSFSGGMFQTQELNPGLLHCRWILYQLNQQGSSQKAAWSHLTANSWLCSLKPHFCTSSATLFFMHTCAPTLFFFLPYRYACVLLICFPIVSGLMLSKKSMSNKYLLNWKIVIFAKKICLF